MANRVRIRRTRVVHRLVRLPMEWEADAHLAFYPVRETSCNVRNEMRITLLLIVVWSCESFSPVHGQVAVPARRIRLIQSSGLQLERLQPIQVPGPTTETGAEDGKSNAAAAQETATSEDTERTKKRKAVLSSLTFDRRPSSILKAWSTVATSEVEDTTSNTAAEESSEKDQPVDGEPQSTQTDESALTEEQRQAAEAAEKQRLQAEKLQKEIDELTVQVTEFKRNVTLAKWEDVARFLKSLEAEEPGFVYAQLLRSLVAGPPDQPKTRNGQIIGERNVIRAADVIALGEMCPAEELEDSHITLLGNLANLCQVEGQAAFVFLDALTEHVRASAENQKITKRTAARILLAADRVEQSQGFLPTLTEAVQTKDVEALDVLSDVFMRLHSREQDTQLLEQAWQAAQALMIHDETEEKLRQKAIRLCVGLVPQLRDELGEKWLTESFTSEPERGMEILAAIGSAAALSMKEQMFNTDERISLLKLQQTAVRSLLQVAPEKSDAWRQTLHLLASNWLREATYSGKYDATSQRGPSMTRDVYGNYYWSQSSSRSSAPNGMPQPIPSGKVLDGLPDDQWLAFLDEGYRSRFSIETARLHLRVKEEADAFPYIEQLAETHKDEARDLVQEFLTVWAENHNPNTQTQRTNIYMFSYGFSQRSNGIPLTRSRQERNLEELAMWVARIRKLPIDDIDEKWISAAFTQVHSQAEVYRLDDMERVFGDINNMAPETLAAMLQTMRRNLANVWRKPEVQQQNSTNRKKNDIEAEVVQGYRTARVLCDRSLATHPENWQLLVAMAALRHDENDYRAELANSSDFADARKSALMGFREAVRAYSSTIEELKETEFRVDPFNFWFNASLGGSDLAQITQDKQPVLSQIPLIRDAFMALPERARDKHLAMFANDLFTRMSNVNPAVKFRYVREGLAIVGEHEQAREARKVFDYYNDLVTEIKLEAILDGSPAVGSQQPFGVFINLHHTKAIERESGGFARYLQNQNNGTGYYYNYGRPAENYRDRFELSAREALDEHFEVLSVTFQPETVASRATAREGWRTTSYAYVLLKPRGPEIDRVPPLKLDLDFTDTTGYAVLPVESQALSIDCATSSPDPRPATRLSVTQTLDERQALDGKLVLEIKATALGLIPELQQLLNLTFADFEVVETEDVGLSVERFDSDSDDTAVVSERLWTITLADKSDAADDSRTFMFASARLPLKEEIWQRYDDADLVAVDQTVVLQEAYDQASPAAVTIGVATGFLLLMIAGGLIYWRTRREKISDSVVHRFQMPQSPTPFNVLSLLKDIEKNNGLSPEGRSELQSSINRIERYFFADERQEEAPDIVEVAQAWVRRAH